MISGRQNNGRQNDIFRYLHINVVSFGNVRNAFRHHEHFVKTMIVDIYHSQLQHTSSYQLSSASSELWNAIPHEE